MHSHFQIRPLQDMRDFIALEELQRQIWHLVDIEIIPAIHLHALSHNGAIILGAFAPATPDTPDALVAFIISIIATVENLDDRIDQVAAARLKLYSVAMGVLPAYQNQGLGYQLKLAQRQAAQKIGLRLITWTFDPLETVNAHLNINKLGGICRHYWPNYHGNLTGINQGLPTDRFNLEWWITGNRAKSRIDKQRAGLKLDALTGGGAVLINEVGFNQTGHITPPNQWQSFNHLMLLVEVPTNFQAIKQADLPLAQAWRQHTQDLFTTAFAASYMITDFIYHRGEEGMERGFYLLTNQTG